MQASHLENDWAASIGLAIATGFWTRSGPHASRRTLEHDWNLGAGLGLAFVFVMMLVSLAATVLAAPREHAAEHPA
ncbi:hypothetical protein [Tsukamurella soli]|uniref:Uncharacterized protein n=1 Tax=Tsukamurella soli TaxID=644556 RepID=A0ABP8JRE3_9ACTN